MKTMKETHIQETKAKEKWAFVSPCTYLPLSQHQDGGELDTREKGAGVGACLAPGDCILFLLLQTTPAERLS